MFIPFNIGLSLLSSKTAARTEGRRILSLLEGRSLTDDDILRGENGRPFFADPEAHCDFNISHSGNAASGGAVTAVSLVRGKGLRTGCDVQRIHTRTNTIKIAEHFFSASEREYIGNNKKRFFEIWTLKECYLKLRGLSVFDMAGAPSFLPGSLPRGFYLYELTGSSGEQYMLAATIEGAEHAPAVIQYVSQPVIQWFSQESLECRSLGEVRTCKL